MQQEIIVGDTTSVGNKSRKTRAVEGQPVVDAERKAIEDKRKATEALNEELRRQKAAVAKAKVDAEAKRKADAEAKRKAEGKPFPWWWIVISLLVAGLLAAILWPRTPAPTAIVTEAPTMVAPTEMPKEALEPTPMKWTPAIGAPDPRAVDACSDGITLKYTSYVNNMPYMEYECTEIRAYVSTPTPTATTTMALTVPPAACRDGELVLVHAADEGDVLDRLPVGEAERVNIVEIGVPGKGFGGYDRFIVVVPSLGAIWQVNISTGARTIASRGFCSTNEAVANWALEVHVPSFLQASRDQDGNQPPASEIGVYILNYEAGTLTELKPGRLSAMEILKWIDLSFHKGTNVSSVILTVAP